jgi:nitrile hydratase subunit beta
MNGVHDMGGLQCMGPIRAEADEPVFHERWESRVFALARSMGAWGKWNIDASRFQREQIPPAEYLRMSYYEIWLTGLIELLVAKGLVTRDEVTRGHPHPGAQPVTPALTVDKVASLVARGSPANRVSQAVPRFQVGQSVRARNMQPKGHTRLPRYARAKQGTIERVHGLFVFPDTNSAFQGEKPQPLYSVKFAARELWGPEAAARDTVCIDLWEDYLEPA